MAWYAYCITEQQAFGNGTRTRRPYQISGMRGIGGAPVLAYPSAEFAVVVSEYEQTGTLDQTSVVEHARVVSECFRNTTVLPFRFGTVFDTDDALRRAVRANRKAFTESVARLRGKAEMHLKVMVRGDGSLRDVLPEAALPTTAGSEYLTKLRELASRNRERQSKARAVSVQVHKLFSPLDEEVTCKKIDSGGLLIDIAHLIDSKTVEKYHNRYSAATKQLKNCDVAISGPWPPYHFTPGKLRTVTPNS
ncbi:MAG: GvpL/GvpF family gas vesicle protein [Terriglobales bacterium]